MTVSKLHHFVELLDTWKHNYAGPQMGSIMFRNDKLLTNVFWNSKSFQTIHKHPKGAEQLPETIENPDQVFSLWEDPKTQRVVLRTYIKGNYIVKTRDGIVVDGLLVDNVSRFRKGVIILV